MLKSADLHKTILTPVICHKHVYYHDGVAMLLYENEAPGLEQVVVVTIATRVLQPLKRAFLCIPPECLTACKI